MGAVTTRMGLNPTRLATYADIVFPLVALALYLARERLSRA